MNRGFLSVFDDEMAKDGWRNTERIWSIAYRNNSTRSTGYRGDIFGMPRFYIVSTERVFLFSRNQRKRPYFCFFSSMHPSLPFSFLIVFCGELAYSRQYNLSKLYEYFRTKVHWENKHFRNIGDCPSEFSQENHLRIEV